jgi:putative nucleotidyltransferase with HDIG domain
MKIGTARRLLRQPRQVWLITLCGVGFILGVQCILLLPALLRTATVLDLQAGEVAPLEVIAPRDITFVSVFLTEQEQQRRAALVQPVYEPPNHNIASRQLGNAQAALNFIYSVRSDDLASQATKMRDLSLLQAVELSPTNRSALLNVRPERWEAVQAEVLRAIAETYRNEIRDGNLQSIQREIPAHVNLLMFSSNEADMIGELAAAFIIPNATYNEAATEQRRSEARKSVLPVMHSYQAGEIIMTRGRVLDTLTIEALRELGYLQSSTDWLELTRVPLLSSIIFVAGVWLYLRRYMPDFWIRPRLVAYILVLSLLFLALGRVLLSQQNLVFALFFPAATFGLLITVGCRSSIGLGVSVLFGVFYAYLSDNNLALVLYWVGGSLAAILSLGKAARINDYFRSGVVCAIANVLFVTIGQGSTLQSDPLGLLNIIGIAIANGGISASLTLLGAYTLARPFNLLTAMQVEELSRPSNPLLQELLRKAPGSYQHSLQIANLAEQAAQAIGANEAWVRLGALYHDIGKAEMPEYFVENQIERRNPHELLSPEQSATIIIDHVRNGYRTAQQARLPNFILDSILQHHGTTRTWYPYNRALALAGDNPVDPTHYTYPGPKPQSKETALLMLADGCEAKARADVPSNKVEIEQLVDYIFQTRIKDGQLQECPLTLADLQIVRDSFVATFRSFYHPRLVYQLPTTDKKVASIQQ